MITLFARHTVSDFKLWNRVYQAFAATLDEAGVVASTVYRSVDDPNDITVAHDFATLEAARSFADGSALRTAGAGVGVAGTPSVWFTTKA